MKKSSRLASGVAHSLVGGNRIPKELTDVSAMAVAYFTFDGRLLLANKGFQRFLSPAVQGDHECNISGLFCYPGFAFIQQKAKQKIRVIHEGLFTLEGYKGTIYSLRGKLFYRKSYFYFIAEHAIQELEYLQQSVMGLNNALAESHRKLARVNQILHKRMETGAQKLHESEMMLELLGKVFANTAEAIFITDANKILVQVNDAFHRITGYEEQDVIGQTPQLLAAQASTAGASEYKDYNAIWETVRDQGRWQGELRLERKSGEEFPIWLSVYSVNNALGEVTQYIGNFSDISRRKAAEARMHHMAYHDPLTQLPNRLNLDEQLTQVLWLAQKNNTGVAVLIVDLDQFKVVNDNLGHPVGDQLLVEIAKRLLLSVRDCDFVARFGGDEFVIVLTNITNIQDVDAIAGKIIRTVSIPCWVNGTELRTSPSIGICMFPQNATQPPDLIRYADVALYDAKAKGRGLYRFYNAAMSEHANTRLALETDLANALEKNQFILHYQPQLDLSSGTLKGVEALLRWQHPLRGLILPNEFISMAEDLGLISPLGDWVLNEACRQLCDWQAQGIGPIRMSINLSASQFRNRHLPYKILSKLQEFNLCAALIDLEVTESMAMESPQETINMLRHLADSGFSLSIDDFGTGYSSLAYLKLFPLHTLKIDCSFVRDIEFNRNDAQICETIVVLAHKLGLTVMAEGVETDHQLQFLAQNGCEGIQGYLLSKPLPPDLACEFIRSYPLTPLHMPAARHLEGA